MRSNRHNSYQRLGLFFLFAVLIAARRWQQFAIPGVWAEDGTVVLPSIFTHGLAALFEPVNGYLILSSKLISWLALSTFGLLCLGFLNSISGITRYHADL